MPWLSFRERHFSPENGSTEAAPGVPGAYTLVENWSNPYAWPLIRDRSLRILYIREK